MAHLSPSVDRDRRPCMHTCRQNMHNAIHPLLAVMPDTFGSMCGRQWKWGRGDKGAENAGVEILAQNDKIREWKYWHGLAGVENAGV